jgi:hypothetical protein
MGAAMRWQRLALALLLYLAADFANPLMPGAVSFPDGAVVAVHGDRLADGDVEPAVPVPGLHQALEAARPGWRPPRPAPSRPVAHWLVPLGRAPLARPDPASATDDH